MHNEQNGYGTAHTEVYNDTHSCANIHDISYVDDEQYILKCVWQLHNLGLVVVHIILLCINAVGSILALSFVVCLDTRNLICKN